MFMVMFMVMFMGMRWARSCACGVAMFVGFPGRDRDPLLPQVQDVRRLPGASEPMHPVVPQEGEAMTAVIFAETESGEAIF